MQTHMTSLLNSLDDREVIDFVLEHGMAVAMFRLPSAGHASLYVSEHPGMCKHTDHDRNAFLFSKFNDNVVHSVPADYSRRIPMPSHPVRLCVDTGCPPMAPDYARRINTLVERLRMRGGKTVLAVSRDLHVDLHIFDIFTRLASAYPDAFVFCWKIPDVPEVWIGATPEVLAEVSGGMFRTMALAGTRRRGADGIPWDEKNIEEQCMVKDFILDILHDQGLDPTCTAPFTKAAGPVEHICNLIEACMPEGCDPLALASALSPTPAVCGLPRAEALSDISGLEEMERGCYGGWCGVMDAGDRCRLFVTLRCMSLDLSARNARLYAGGGITHKSDAAAEWAEVNAKMGTLLSVLQGAVPAGAEQLKKQPNY